MSSVKETTIILKVDDNCKLEMNRSAIGSVILDEKTKANRLANVPEKTSPFSSFFKKKEKKTEDSGSEKPQPPNFSGEVE